MMDAQERIKMIDPTPAERPEKMTFRSRYKEKEIAHSYMRTQNTANIDRLNEMYEDDLKILNCDMDFKTHTFKHKRLTQNQARAIVDKENERKRILQEKFGAANIS